MQANAACFKEASERYGVPEHLLRAIAKVESGGLPAHKAENRNANGSRDIGRMQINSTWLPTLAKYGITEAHLRDECTSIQIGAWIMAGNASRHGLGWEAVGAYNVGCRQLSADECTKRRNKYSWKVFNAIKAPAESPQASRPVQAPIAQRFASVSFEE